MIDLLTLLAFIPAALALNLTPGADMTFCLGQGLKGGPQAALRASAGIAVGCMVHVVIAALGLGALVEAHPAAFDAIRWAGVAYLVWLAVRTLRAPPGLSDSAPADGRAFWQGFATNLLNPKVILFVLAFLPQFTDPARPLMPQFLILGGIIAAGGFVINGAVGLAAGSLGRALVRNPSAGRWLSRITATLFLGLAARLALVQR